MSITRGQLKNQILVHLNLNAGYQGYFTDEKLDSLIQEAIDYVSVEMMMCGEGWLSNIKYFDTAPAVAVYELPKDIAVINAVRYLSGASYVPVVYDDQADLPQMASSAGFTAFPSKYRILQNKIYFNPVPVFSGPKYLQIEYVAYPSEMMNDGQMIDPQFDRASLNFIKWFAICRAVGSRKDVNPDFLSNKNEWYDQMMKVVNKRIRTKTFVKEFQA